MPKQMPLVIRERGQALAALSECCIEVAHRWVRKITAARPLPAQLRLGLWIHQNALPELPSGALAGEIAKDTEQALERLMRRATGASRVTVRKALAAARSGTRQATGVRIGHALGQLGFDGQRWETHTGALGAASQE
jgi:hypothetical protein